MDAVMDLTARAVSFITLIQDTFTRASVRSDDTQPKALTADGASIAFSHNFDYIFGNGFAANFSNKISTVKTRELQINIENNKKPEDDVRPLGIEGKILELVWFSEKNADADDKLKAEQYVVELCNSLVEWINNNRASIITKVNEVGAFAPPYIWRDAISEIVYFNIDKRIELAEALEYVPIHIVLALGGANYPAGHQRILQWWQTNKKQYKIVLTDAEAKLHDNFKEIVYKKFEADSTNASTENINATYRKQILIFWHYRELTKQLIKNEAPLPFEYIYNEELDEIRETRKLRNKELLLPATDANQVPPSPNDNGYGTSLNGNGVDTTASLKHEYSCDPFVRAKEMKLFALAFSGGGIRSATFNLGLLQGLAKQGVLSKVDYLSTVSGGGYIGSWLATWIKRNGSVKNVTDRLNPQKSPDPLGEEVRPIRWLRMFSNYFTPNKSIMSVDSWTVGVTWLRNTLLNQLVIFLMLLSALLLARSLFEFWLYQPVWDHRFPASYVYVTSCLFLLLLAFFTGIGMQWYSKGRSPMLPFKMNDANIITRLVAGIAITGSYIVSASLFAQDLSTYYHKLGVLWPAGAVTLIILILIAVLGRYDKCIMSMGKGKFRANFIIFYTAVISALVGTFGLAAAWKLFEVIKLKLANHEAFAFSVGLPLILIVFGLTVVSRMAMLGKYFPDERREWWGRMGAVINRVAFIWILVSASTFLLRGVLNPLLHSWKAPATVGGWMAIIGGTVKAAFSSKTSGKGEATGFTSVALDVLSKAGPYLFALGLLIFLPALVQPLMNKNLFPLGIEERMYLKALLFAAILFLPALFLSWRLGVNEFSMHHFYRNRLVRAYLGATRRRSSREKTSNPFTGFDKWDDEKLSKFRHEQGYFGPYPVLNTALNATQFSDLSRQDRKAESFIFSPLYCGFDFSKVRSSADARVKSYDYGYRPTAQFAYPNDKGPGIGTAMAISGAAVNPNQGYHSSAATAFLLTVFNVQMGWWIGNPRKSKWQKSDPNFGLAYIFYNLSGQTNTKNEFVCLSDGGHFDNMGLYEMVRRRCTFIILGDGEQDEKFACEGFANAIRKCRIDFGAEISIDIDDIVKRKNRFSKSHYAIGKITYSGDTEPKGTLLYIKSSITGDEPVDVTEYSSQNITFPHQTTADQFFDEEQFESYRKLGMHIADGLMADKKVMKEFNLSYSVPHDDKVLDVIEKPVKNLFNTLKDFFMKKDVEKV